MEGVLLIWTPSDLRNITLNTNVYYCDISVRPNKSYTNTVKIHSIKRFYIFLLSTYFQNFDTDFFKKKPCSTCVHTQSKVNAFSSTYSS